jgi:hypothetical protein
MNIEKVILVKSNLNLLQTKIWSWLFFKAFNHSWFKNRFTASFDELKNAIDYAGDNEDLKEEILSLMQFVINLYEFEDTKTIMKTSSILSFCEIDNNIIHYHYNDLIEIYVNKADMFKKALMLVQNQFHSKHSRILYGLCLNNFDPDSGTGEITIYTEQVRRYFRLKEYEYPTFGEISRTLLKKAVEEINDKSNLFINMEYLKQGKTVIAVKFKINLNAGNLLLVPGLNIEKKPEPSKELILNKELLEFLNKNKISVTLVQQRFNTIIDSGISTEFLAEYLLFIKSLYENNRTGVGQEAFLTNLSQKKNIEVFLQKLAAEEMNKYESQESELHKLYTAYELVKAVDYLKHNRDLFIRLLAKHQDNPCLKNTSHLPFNMLENNIGIAQILLQDIQKSEDFLAISFEEWKEKMKNKNCILS